MIFSNIIDFEKDCLFRKINFEGILYDKYNTLLHTVFNSPKNIFAFHVNKSTIIQTKTPKIKYFEYFEFSVLQYKIIHT